MLATFFVGKPLHALFVVCAFLAAHVLRRFMVSPDARQTSWLLVAAALWAAYAAWEWSILKFSPDADIRVDLLLIFPILGIVSLWAVFRAIR